MQVKCWGVARCRSLKCGFGRALESMTIMQVTALWLAPGQEKTTERLQHKIVDRVSELGSSLKQRYRDSQHQLCHLLSYKPHSQGFHSFNSTLSCKASSILGTQLSVRYHPQDTF